MNSTNFQADIKSFAETEGDQCADPGLLDIYDTATLHWPPDASATVPQPPGWQTVSRPLSTSWDEQNASGGTHAWPCTERSTPSNEASWRLWWEQRGNFTSVPGLRTVQTPSSSFQCPVGFLASQRPHHSRLIYHVLHSRTDFACFSLKKSRTSDETLTLTLLNQQHSLPMMVLNSVFSSLSLTEEEIRKLIVESPTKTCMLDPIPTSLTKECLSDLLPLIARIVNLSLFWSRPTSVQAGRSNPYVKETWTGSEWLEEFSTRVKSALHLQNPRKGGFNAAAETSIRKRSAWNQAVCI